MLSTHFLTNRARAMAVVLSAEVLADFADAVVVVLTAPFFAHGAHAVVTVISPELVFIGHAGILVSSRNRLDFSNFILSC